jgi:hypothetical protein
MELLTYNEVREIVLKAIHTIADLPNDPDEATFEMLQPEHKNIFVTALSEYLKAFRYVEGGPYHDVAITSGQLDEFENVKALINFTFEEQIVVTP